LDDRLTNWEGHVVAGILERFAAETVEVMKRDHGAFDELAQKGCVGLGVGPQKEPVVLQFKGTDDVG